MIIIDDEEPKKAHAVGKRKSSIGFFFQEVNFRVEKKTFISLHFSQLR